MEVNKIITIERKLLSIRIQTHYFQKDNSKKYLSAHLTGYSHSFIAKEGLKSFETLQIDLSKTEEILMAEMHKSTRRQVRKASGESFEHIIIENPKHDELLKFQTFYNEFAKNKKTCKCTAYHMQTMMLLSEKKALMLTYIKDKEDEIYCYRIYITNGNVAMNLYSASHFRMVESPEQRRLLGYANRYLIWQSILWAKEKGHRIYDMGGLTTDENIRRFKFGFGGEVVTAYSGYKARSNFAKLFLKFRDWKLGIRNVGNAQ